MATSARIDELRKKFEENPRRYFAPLANEYRKAGDPERAVAICEEYLPQQPGHMSGHIVYGQTLFELGRHDEARQVFETALSLDPENLIALRHLGDIARTGGDHHAARIWYQRVLEADPRNEEIAQLMMSLLATPVGSDVIAAAVPTPLNSPAVTRASSPTPGAAVEEPLDDPQLSRTDEMETPRTPGPAYTPFPPPPVSPQSFVSRHAPKEEELLDLDSFDLGGVPLSSLRNAKSPEPEVTPEPAEAMADAEGDSAFAEFDEQLSASATPDEPIEEVFVEQSFVAESFAEPDVFEASSVSPTSSADANDTGIEKAQEFADGFEPDPYAIAAKPLTDGEVGSFEEAPPGTIELATDVSLGLPDDGGSSSTFMSEEESPVDGLERFEAGFIAGRPSSGATADSLETESFFETPVDIGEPSADALLDAFVEDSDGSAGASAFSQVRDDTTESSTAGSSFDALVDEPVEAPIEQEPWIAEMPIDEASAPLSLDTPNFGTPIAVASSTPFPPFPLAGSETSTTEFHEALPASSQGDPLMAAAFGDAEVLATSDTAEAEAHVPAAEASGSEPGAFVTETMATLYLEQGHFDAALDIYRQLVQQRPDDIALRDRLHAAEERAWGHQRDLGSSILDEPESSSALVEAEDEIVPSPRSYGGPTIREFLTGLLYSRSMTTVEELPPSSVAEDAASEIGAEPEPEVAPEPEAGAEPVEDVAAMAELPPPPPPRSTPAPSSGDSLTTSLGALFSEADSATSSASAREGGSGSLEGRVATPIGGTPAHRAPKELSLDHVFKSNTPRMPSKDGFSFDQFFSEGAAEDSTPNVEPASEPRAETGDDIAQFNAWLNGLKKS